MQRNNYKILFDELIKAIESNNHYSNCETGLAFEEIVKEALKYLQKIYDFSFNDNGKHAFPDLIVVINDKNIGLEVKFSASGSWSSNANSVFESISNKEENAYDDIYVIFGRKPKINENKDNLEVRINKYSNIISSIAVTHSPRFLIDMNTRDESFFSELDVSYEEFRKFDNNKKNLLLREYFANKNKEKDKWYIPLQINKDEDNILPQRFSSLDENQKKKLIAEAFILFPTDLFRKRAIYFNVEDYFLNRYFIISSSLRDHFTAGGKADLNNESHVKYPKMVTVYKNVERIIDELLEDPSEEFINYCYSSWNKQKELIELGINSETNIKNAFNTIKTKLAIKIEIEDKLEESRQLYSTTIEEL